MKALKMLIKNLIFLSNNDLSKTIINIRQVKIDAKFRQDFHRQLSLMNESYTRRAL
jgi:hypothetical protein